MLEYITLILIVIICLFIKADYKILNLFLLIIPFHSFIKGCFTYYYGGGFVFSYWKEFLILILAFKTFRSSFLKLNKQLKLTIVIFFSLIICYFFISNDLISALPTLRDYLFPLILFISISKIKLSDTIIKKIIAVFAISILLTDIFGFIQHFLLNEQLSQIMGYIDFIDSNGYIQYNTTSSRIMGFERMAGILGAGPNMFGVFNGFAIVFLFGVLTNKGMLDSKFISSKLLIFILILSVICIILSFSRVGWIIALFGSFILLVNDKKINRVKYFSFFTLSFILVISILVIYIPKAGDIIYNSISGKEESASKRSEMITNLIPAILDEPFGHGLGTTDNRLNTKLFFAESALTNIAFEIGVLGMFYLIFMHFLIIKQIIKLLDYNFFSSIAISIGVISLIISLVSINAFGPPYVYLWWFILGLGINKSNLKKRSKSNLVYKDLKFKIHRKQIVY
jgi:hypothetical protein